MAPYVREKALRNKIRSTQKKKKKLVSSKIKLAKDVNEELYNNKNENEHSGTIEIPEENEDLTCELESNSFDSLSDILSKKTLNIIQKVGFKQMTPVQAKCIPVFLKGYHVRAAAKTGSGKTLAFLIPAIELIQRLKYKPSSGTGIIILSPTRELTMQTYGVLKELTENLSQTVDILMGTTHHKAEEKRLLKGVNILVCTPQRLIYHLQNTKGFYVDNVFCTILDEADRLIDGFEEELKEIYKYLPSYRQTVMFSATVNEQQNKLAKIVAPKSEFQDINIDQDEAMATVSTLEQSFTICPTERKLYLLLTFLKMARRDNKKVMIFFICCEAVKFYHHMISYTQFPVMCIHGSQDRHQRERIFHKFSKAETGLLFCTDVAARGWDVPAVDWIIHYDPPLDATSYIHRVGRTARAGATGKSLLILTEGEVQFLQYLKEARVDLIKKDVQWPIVDQVNDFQEKFEQVVAENLHQLAKYAFRGFIRAYKAHKLKDCFIMSELNIREASKCFGFRKPPQVRDITKMKPTKNHKEKDGPKNSKMNYTVKNRPNKKRKVMDNNRTE